MAKQDTTGLPTPPSTNLTPESALKTQKRSNASSPRELGSPLTAVRRRRLSQQNNPFTIFRTELPRERRRGTAKTNREDIIQSSSKYRRRARWYSSPRGTQTWSGLALEREFSGYSLRTGISPFESNVRRAPLPQDIGRRFSHLSILIENDESLQGDQTTGSSFEANNSSLSDFKTPAKSEQITKRNCVTCQKESPSSHSDSTETDINMLDSKEKEAREAAMEDPEIIAAAEILMLYQAEPSRFPQESMVNESTIIAPQSPNYGETLMRESKAILGKSGKLLESDLGPRWAPPARCKRIVRRPKRFNE